MTRATTGVIVVVVFALAVLTAAVCGAEPMSGLAQSLYLIALDRVLSQLDLLALWPLPKVEGENLLAAVGRDADHPEYRDAHDLAGAAHAQGEAIELKIGFIRLLRG